MSIDIGQLKFTSEGLIPCVAFDVDTRQVLMLAYMNETAIHKTLETGEVTYFSRSRGRLWTKGETSGNRQQLIALKADCDGDTLLAEVRQTGVACHTGTYSCFGERDTLTVLMQTIKSRKNNPKVGSYTNYLLDKGLDKILKKVGEEAAEVIIASKNDNQEVISEAADLLYHLFVLFECLEINFEDVLKKLEERR